MEMYIHRPGQERITLVEVGETATVAEVVGLAEGEAAWLEDGEETIRAELTVAAARIQPRGHVHVNRCRRAAVTVNYNGGERRREFAPSATVRRAFEWAVGKDGFDLPEHDRPEHALQLCGTTTQPDGTDHIGSFVNDECQGCFDLVPKHRFQG